MWGQMWSGREVGEVVVACFECLFSDLKVRVSEGLVARDSNMGRKCVGEYVVLRCFKL
jgi:hypothetical protein